MKKIITAISLIVPMLITSLVHAETGIRLEPSVGMGILVAGDKHATGGFAFSGAFLIGTSLTDSGSFGVSYQNLVLLNTFKTVKSMGVYDQNAFMAYLKPSDNVSFDFGPSLDLFSMILCNNENFCDRQSGMAGGAHFRFSVVGKSALGFVANAHWSWIPSDYYSGSVWSANVGPVWKF